MLNNVNAGYVITDKVVVDNEVAFVIGYNEKAPEKYVVWRYNPKSNSYFWGKYTNNKEHALRYMFDKALEELELQKESGRR
jgi:hypothetical protein